MIQKIRDSRFAKGLLMFALLNFLGELFAPSVSLALTGGPSQPEVESFTPIGTSDMVNLASGDFNYNIPLLDVGGYPINIAYNSGVTMDQEASWVGLGWNINPGAINRGKRGIPDDFKGDEITSTKNMKPNITTGASVSSGTEVFGANIPISASKGINYNSYNGFYLTRSVGLKFSFGKSNQFTTGLGLNSSTNNGLSISPSIAYNPKLKETDKTLQKMLTSFQANTGMSWNSRQGMTSMTIGASLPKRRSIRDLIFKKRSPSGLGGSMSFSSSTYTPPVQHSMLNSSLTFTGKLGSDFIGSDASADISGYFSMQNLINKVEDSKSYGYQYLGEGQNNEDAILDFNREKDAAFVKGTPNLPLTNLTYDLFNVNGHGVAGQFRSFQSAVGSVYDQKVTSNGFGAQGGAEIGVGNLNKAGFDVSANYSNSKSGKWRSNTNPAGDKLKFSRNNVNNMHEATYFRNVGEPSKDEEFDRFYELGGFNPVRVGLNKGFMSTKTSSHYVLPNGQNLPISNNFSRSERVSRNQLINYVLMEDVPKFGLENLVSASAKSHHIGEFSILKNDGSKYVYGLPAYNRKEVETTFNVGSKTNDGSGLVTYDDSDNTPDNKKGVNHYYQSTETPPYSHSHLLTAVLSDDYQDLDDVRGPSIGDLGSYVSLSYQPSTLNYKWRVPYQEKKANYSEGLLSLNGDNTGSYVYGEKELWYVEKLETKTHVAVFYVSDRRDAFEVKGEDGGIDIDGGQTQQKLDKIELYTRPDYDENGTNGTPVKTVHFEYSYELCPEVPNNDEQAEIVNGEDVNSNHGKLTLKKIYFTYGNSKRGKLSSYNFNYDNDNPSYDMKAYDMWSNYKPYGSDVMKNAYFPYVDQYEDREDLDSYASSWSLSSIDLPSGGTIKIEYESDDYKFVQNRLSSQMLDVVNVTNTSSYEENTNIDKTDLFNSQGTPNQYLWVELLPKDKNNTSFSKSEFKQTYLKTMSKESTIYFNFLMNLNFVQSIKEYVSGYADLDSGAIGNEWYGVDTDSNGKKFGYIKIKNVKEENNSSGPTDAHPIAKATWQFVRSSLPQLLQPGNTFSTQNLDQTNIIEALASFFTTNLITELVDIFKGPNGSVRMRGIGNSFDASSSWVRLKNPNGKKVGGGSRVSKISMNDAWDAMVPGEADAAQTYSQEYIYELEDGTSSGVATYEPTISKENPFVQPKYFDKQKRLIPDEKYMLETPYGATFFPSPLITYSKVIVKNTYPEDGNKSTPTDRRTGKVVNEFYTTKDFPTIVKETRLESAPMIGDNLNLLNLLNLVKIEEQTVSQGYTVIKNNMNGTLKAKAVFAENGTAPISKVEYKYKRGGYGGLDNTVQAVDKSGDVSEVEVGVDFDVSNDFRRNRTLNVTGGAQVNFNTFIVPPIPIFPIPPIPIFIPTVYPSGSFEHTVFKSAVTTKIINRTGILDKVITTKDGATVTDENILWDSETGEVLLTRSNNEYGDDIYNFNIPAHWSYDKMGQAYKNINLKLFGFTKVSQGVYEVPLQYSGVPLNQLVQGDVVKVINTGNVLQNVKAWVLDIDLNEDKITLINKQGELLDGFENIMIEVMESGRENKQALTLGSITSKVSPVDPNINRITDEYLSSGLEAENRIISASANEYSDHWSVKEGFEGECQHVPNASGTALISLFNQLVSNGHLGNNSQVFEEINTSSFDDYSDLFDVFCPITEVCGEFYQNCSSSINIKNFTHPDNDQLELRFACDGTQDDCNYYSQYPIYINAVGPQGFTSSYNLENVNSFYFDLAAYNQYGAQFVAEWSDGTTIPISATGNADCMGNFVECSENGSCGFSPGDDINPFITNLRGIFRPYRSYVKLGDREQTMSSSDIVNTREEGYMLDFEYFWKNPETGENWQATPNSDGIGENEWTWNSTITKNVGYNQNGKEQENKDALYRYSASTFGYQDKLPLAVAQNATKGQIGFDGFEDYSFYPTYGECAQRHFSFENHFSQIVDFESHTGKHSIRLASNEDISMERNLITAPCDNSDYGYPTFGEPYKVSECETYNQFGPETYNRAAYERSVFEEETPVLEPAEQKYVISYWVKKENQGSSMNQDFSDLTPMISIDQNPLTLNNERQSMVIDKWQKIEYTFDIPGFDPATAGSKVISVGFVNQSEEAEDIMYVDDIRIHPFNSSLKSYVYDPLTLRLTAELDDNNFATFYEYDNEGKLIRVKKETERGIMTIQENRNHTAQ